MADDKKQPSLEEILGGVKKNTISYEISNEVYKKPYDLENLKAYANLMGFDETSVNDYFEALCRTTPQQLQRMAKKVSQERYKNLGDLVKQNYSFLVEKSDQETLLAMARGASGLLKTMEEFREAIETKDYEKMREKYLNTWKNQNEIKAFVEKASSDSITYLATSYLRFAEGSFVSQFTTEEGKGLDVEKIRKYLQEKGNDKSCLLYTSPSPRDS